MSEALSAAKGRMLSRRRWLQFRLATLLAWMTAAALGAHWFAQRKRVEKSRHEFEAAAVKYDIGTTTFGDLYKSSSRLFSAELAVPFANGREARIDFLNRTARLERKTTGMFKTGLCGSTEALEQNRQWMLQLRAEREKLEEELGVKAAQ